jgi:hypothetical protein
MKMAYKEISVLVGGALEQTEIFDYDSIMDVVKMYAFIAETQKDSADLEELVELYELSHDHEPDVSECNCVQYINDHHPFWTNKKESK